MSKGRDRWQDGRRAWQRLNGWHQDAPSATPGHPDDGDEALTALADIGLIRHLLDQAELVAVRTARRHAKSWAEIATKLGVTRQSAWERWRDLDETAGSQPPYPSGGDEVALDVAGTAAAALVEQATAGIGAGSAEATERAARERRRRSSTVVPNVIGMSWNDARLLLLDKGLVAAGPDPDGPPLVALGPADRAVIDQSPESGAKVPPGSSVTLCEPRRPRPDPKGGREMRAEPSDEAVG
jgi:hypothetical protein